MKDTMSGCALQHPEDDYAMQGDFDDDSEDNIKQFKFSQTWMSEKLVPTNNLKEETNLAN